VKGAANFQLDQGLREHAEVVPKFLISLHTSYAALTMVTSTFYHSIGSNLTSELFFIAHNEWAMSGNLHGRAIFVPQSF
jgi:hypothetical protein